MEMHYLDGPPSCDFDCGRDEQNSFFFDRAWSDSCRSISVTHVLYVKGIMAAYVTLMNDRIQLGPRERAKGVTYQLVPAIKLAQLGVDMRFAGNGVGKQMVAYAIETSRRYRGVVGCRYVTLDASPDLVAWYEGQGFVANKEEQRHREQLAAERGRPIDALPRSMRFDLRDVRDPAG